MSEMNEERLEQLENAHRNDWVDSWWEDVLHEACREIRRLRAENDKLREQVASQHAVEEVKAIVAAMDYLAEYGSFDSGPLETTKSVSGHAKELIDAINVKTREVLGE